MDFSIKRSLVASAAFAAMLIATTHQGAIAHNKAELQKQINSCHGSWWGYSYYIECGYGRSEVHFSNFYSTDKATDTHCAYTKLHNKTKNRDVEVKSCGGTRRNWLSTSDQNGRVASCITGSWFCYWKDFSS